MRALLESHAFVIALASFLMLVGTIALLPFVLIQIPEDYFLPGHESKLRRHPVARAFVIIARNVLALVLLAAGIAMLFLPGQGLLTIVVALIVADFPGKRRIELAILRRPAILRAVNRMRAKLRHPPLRMPQPEPKGAVS